MHWVWPLRVFNLSPLLVHSLRFKLAVEDVVAQLSASAPATILPTAINLPPTLEASMLSSFCELPWSCCSITATEAPPKVPCSLQVSKPLPSALLALLQPLSAPARL